jgi:hypothetical protein
MTSEKFKKFMKIVGLPLTIVGTLSAFEFLSEPLVNYVNKENENREVSEKKAKQAYTIAAGNDRIFSCEEKRQFLDDMGLREKYKILDCGKNVILEYSGGEYVLSVCEFWKDNNIISKKTIDDYIARHTK